MCILPLAALDAQLTLAPERLRSSAMAGEGEPLSSLLVERNERVAPNALEECLVLDTTHVRDGWLDLQSPRLTPRANLPTSAKKRVRVGDLLISRLRPYLRQVGWAHPRVFELLKGKPLAVSTEFYVFRSAEAGEELAWLVPFLLGADVQAHLAAGQEGGHHPRVPRETLGAIRVPRTIAAMRRRTNGQVRDALETLYDAWAAWEAILMKR